MFLKIFSSILDLMYILIRAILVIFHISFLRNIPYIYILTDISNSIFLKVVRSGSGILQSLLPYGFLLLLTELLQTLPDVAPVTLQDQNYDETVGFPYNYVNCITFASATYATLSPANILFPAKIISSLNIVGSSNPPALKR